MKNFKVLGARDLGRDVAYCVAEIVAENKEQAKEKFLKENRIYEIIRIEEI